MSLPLSGLGHMLLTAVVLSPAVAVAAEGVKVEGLAAIVDDDLAAARDRAVDDAKRRAVEQVAGARVSATSVSENYQLVRDEILSRADGFVRQYEILDEVREGETYRVRIQAEVDADALVDDLALVFETKPRVVVLVAEQNLGADRPEYWWGRSGATADLSLTQTHLIRAWQPRGYTFVDPGLLSGEVKVSDPLRTPELSNEAARTLGQELDADVAVVGQVLVNDAGHLMEGVQMRAFHAVGTLRALSIGTGEILAVSEATGTSAHVDPNLGGRLALRAFAAKAGGALEKQLLRRWMAEAASTRPVELIVHGVRTGRETRRLEKVVRERIRGVASVHTRRRRNGTAFVAVKVRARVQDFARDLEAADFSDYTLSISEVGPDRVVGELTRGLP